MDDCLEQLPSSIEAYLEEAGFSGTEIIVLRKLLEGDALTLRELAAKTGKSTGVLDQAMKKLIKKRIIAREMVNDAPRYILKSLQPVLEWMEDDMEQKRAMIVRRHQNFEAFISSLQVGKKRPEMEYFEGIEGIKKAYNLLLNRGNDFVQYGPTLYLAEEDPLRDFRVQHFRERHRRGIFARVITHNTVLGRRFQSRDPYEYRKTILVDEETYPFHFEKIIVGDTVACFQLREEQVCFIRYPELAEEERVFFERLWNKKSAYEQSSTPKEAPPPLLEAPATLNVINVPLKTRTFSQLRQFFLSKTSIVSFLAFALIAAAAAYGIYRHNVAISTVRIQERVKSIAATGAIQFDPADLENLRTLKDVERPEYRKVVYQLEELRRQNTAVAYAYILRPTQDPVIWEFVADADSINPLQKIDYNKDGTLDQDDISNFPGQLYPNEGADPPVEYSLQQAIAFEPYEDQWGTVISGWAPIRDKDGISIAVLGIDVFAEEAELLAGNSTLPLVTFFGVFILFILVRLAAFNRSLAQELLGMLRRRSFIYVVLFLLFILLIAVYGMHRYTIALLHQQTGERLMAIAVTAASQINAEDLEPLRFARDMKREEYQRVFKQLNDIRKNNPDITWAYIWRPTEQEGIWEFVVDADSNYFIPDTGLDYNFDQQVTEADENVAPGTRYDIVTIMPKIYREGLKKSLYEISQMSDQWGHTITGSAPIRDRTGKAVAVLGLDIIVNFAE